MEDENKIIGEGVGFERVRRITGYLVGTTNRWNNAKRAELKDRVVHIERNEEDVHNENQKRNSTKNTNGNI